MSLRAGITAGVGEPSIGSTLAGYRLDSLLARGGMGVVYRATQLALERPVALKVIARELAGDEAFRARFLRESRLAARLDHPNVVPVYDAREEDGELIVAMKLVEGGDLRRLIDREGPLEPERALLLLGQVADALDAAHAAGIVHRDVKPHNVLVEGERAYLSDFGLAKAIAGTGAGSASVVGTVEYMAPEQWRGEAVDPAADVYSLGCVLYETLTGVAPFARGEADTEPRLPAGIEAVIERAVAKDPGERFRTAGALIEAARECVGEAPAKTRVLSEPHEEAAGGGPLGRIRPWRRAIAGIGLGWFVSGLVLVAVLTIIAIVELGGDGVSVSDPVAIGRPPLRLAVGPRSVWVTSAADGTLSKVDSDSRQVVGTTRVGKGVSGVAIGAGSVWVSNPRSGEVLRVDSDGQAIARVAIGGRPGALAFAGGRLWVADEDGRGVSAIDAATNRPAVRWIAPHSAPLRLAAGAGAVWVSSASAGVVRRIDLVSATTGPPIRVGRGPAGITVGGGTVWVANSRSATVTRVDPSLRAVVGAPIPVGTRPGGIDAGTDTVWVASTAEATVIRLDVHTGNPTGAPISVPPVPGAIAVGPEAVWVTSNNDGTITRIEP